MSLRLKLNILLLTVLISGVLVAALLTHYSEVRRETNKVRENSELLAALVMATRKYTSDEIEPLLRESNEVNFHRQSIPSFGAQTIFSNLRASYPEFSYREATLNPTNRKDLATSWETESINKFVENPDLKEIFGQTRLEDAEVFFLARPIRVSDGKCLLCHTTPEIAPKSMVEQYGRAGGFGWKLGDVIGAQILTVPRAGLTERAKTNTMNLVISILSVFICLIILINVFFRSFFIEPLHNLVRFTERFNRNDRSLPHLPGVREDEIGALERALNLTAVSFQALIKRVEERASGDDAKSDIEGVPAAKLVVETKDERKDET